MAGKRLFLFVILVILLNFATADHVRHDARQNEKVVVGDKRTLRPQALRVTCTVPVQLISSSRLMVSTLSFRPQVMATDRKLGYKAPTTIITDRLISQEARRNKVIS